MTDKKLRAMVAEDNFLLAEAIVDSLSASDFEVVSCVGTLASGLQAARTLDIDIAIVDIDLHGESAYALLDALTGRQVAFVMASSKAARTIPDRFADHLLVSKPYSRYQLDRAIKRSIASSEECSGESVNQPDRRLANSRPEVQDQLAEIPPHRHQPHEAQSDPSRLA